MIALKDKVDELAALLKDGGLQERDTVFARSLVDSFGKYGRLSEKQEYWVGRLVAQTVVPPSEPKKVEVDSMSGLIDLFVKAKQKLKWPKLDLEIDGQPVRLALLGERSKNAGSVSVTDGAPFSISKYFGHVTSEGQWVMGRSATPDWEDKLAKLLKAFSRNAAKAAAEYGHLTGRCCMCNKKLSDERSTFVGYGKTCASNWGLPWGEK